MVKKRLALLLGVLLMFCFTSSALGEGEAAVAKRTLLLDSPGGEALMRYYVGVRVRVTGEETQGYLPVRVGEGAGSLSGYMAADDLAFDEMAIRGLPAEWAGYAFYENGVSVTMYAAPSYDAPVLGQTREIYSGDILGSCGVWVHLSLGRGETRTYCFFRRDEVALDGPWVKRAPYVEILPTDEEMSWDEAIAAAKEFLLACEEPELYVGTPDIEITPELLERSEAEVRSICYGPPEEIQVRVSFINPETRAYEVSVSFVMRGREILSVIHGEG